MDAVSWGEAWPCWFNIDQWPRPHLLTVTLFTCSSLSKSQQKEFGRIKVHLGWPMSKLGLCSHAVYATTEWCTGRWQLAFDSLVFVSSVMLLPGLWHRCDCLVEKQLTRCGEFSLLLTVDLSQRASRWTNHAVTRKQSRKSEIWDYIRFEIFSCCAYIALGSA